jgi:cobalt/nickel transport system permease protein
MHMADALLSPTVGAVMWTATAVVTAYSARKVQSQLDNKKIPLMGAIGAFVFAVQMINFAIPGTGSSGHLGGGLLLAILLGPHAAFLTLASVLTVQALFFADGGLLALGCNIFNLGFLPCYICYPLIFKKIVRNNTDQKLLITGSIVAAIVGLQLGSLGVVLQTYFSNITALPFTSFLIIMQPIHLIIGLVEGIATAGIVSFIWKARPEFLEIAAKDQPLGNPSIKSLIAGFLIIAAITGGVLAWFTSEHPDSLEWSIERVAGSQPLESSGNIHKSLENVQKKTTILPEYGFKNSGNITTQDHSPTSLRAGTTVSGLLGGILIMASSILIGLLLKKRNTIS